MVRRRRIANQLLAGGGAHPASGGTPFFHQSPVFEHSNFLDSRCEIPQFAGTINPNPHF